MIFKWKLPIDWCHAGLPQGNGLFGTLVWGHSKTLKITFNRADYWFYGENLPSHPEQSYANLKKYLADGNGDEINRIFGGVRNGVPPQSSSRLPMGHFELEPLSATANGQLTLDTASSLGIYCTDDNALQVRTVVPRGLPLLAIAVSGTACQQCQCRAVPPVAADIRDFFHHNGFPPIRVQALPSNDSGGWIQEVPGSRTLAVCWQTQKVNDSIEIFLAVALEERPAHAAFTAKKIVTDACGKGFSRLATETASWWQEYWRQTPCIELPDAELNELYHLGMYRLAGLCAPDAPAATLQGPWVEDDRMPPWSSDYHFNINVQECYWPVFAGNVPEFVQPLFAMIKRWTPVMQDYAFSFVGVTDGRMLPIATDDRGLGMGGFWTGHIDLSCTAWLGQLMWNYWKYTKDDHFMGNTLYPFLTAVLAVYDNMLEEDAEGHLFLAAESSAEYHGDQLNACGRNPSIHLAAVHFLVRALQEIAPLVHPAASCLARWRKIADGLPLVPVTPEGTIGIWEGQSLDEPHRHFSHLAALHPFDLLDWRNSKPDAELLNKTISQWIKQGTGLWSGWSFPWASIIYSRLEMPEAAQTMLSVYRRAFMKDDYALRYLPGKSCFISVLGRPTHIMQLEAGMAAAAAVMEMCVYSSQGVIYPFASIPGYWHDLTFTGIRTEGAFLISGRKVQGLIREMTIEAEKGGLLRFRMPPGIYRLERSAETATYAGGNIFQTSTVQGEKIIFTRLEQGL